MPIDLARLIIIDRFAMPQLARTRSIRIYLPMDYFTSARAYPVLYMHDGQNVLQDETASYGYSWQVAQSLDAMFVQDPAKACIVVAIDCNTELAGASRFAEYAPWQIDSQFSLPSRADIQASQLAAEGESYSTFITETLKPFIDSEFRTLTRRDTTFMAGSSMGGIISLYIGLTRADVFGSLGVFSPACWFNRAAIFAWLKEVEPSYQTRLYLDIGGQETSDAARADFPTVYWQDARAMCTQLLQKPRLEIAYQEVASHQHNEQAWAARFPTFADWMLSS